MIDGGAVWTGWRPDGCGEDVGTHAPSQPGDVNATVRAFALVLLAAMWSMVAHVPPAAASVQTPPSPLGSASAPEDAAVAPYLSVAVGFVRSANTRFGDGDNAGHYAPYGSEDLFDAGTFAAGLQGGFAVGAKVASRLRVQLELSLARRLHYRGNTNYLIAGERQPSEAMLDAGQLLVAGFYDLPGWTLDPGRTVRPFLGAGAGITGYRLSGYVQRFPNPVDPRGRLRRGPGGEIPFTAIPGGSVANRAWMLAAGVAVPIGHGVQFVLDGRYSGLGEIRTDIGEMTVVRYRNDGTRGENLIRINETAAELRTHSLLVAHRVRSVAHRISPNRILGLSARGRFASPLTTETARRPTRWPRATSRRLGESLSAVRSDALSRTGRWPRSGR